jgi:hypothetical protein
VTADGLFLGRTPLVERRDQRFVARNRAEIERLLGRAYQVELPIDRLMHGFASVAVALNANDVAWHISPRSICGFPIWPTMRRGRIWRRKTA